MRKTCKQCCYGDQCASVEVCKYYTPLGDDYDDFDIENIIEAQRIDFRAEWFEYIKEFDK